MIDIASRAIEFSKRFAQDWLSRYMLKDSKDKAEQVARVLSDNRQWLSHGKRIGIAEAINIGLRVEAIDRESSLWRTLWQYYCRAIVHLNGTGSIKLYESKKLTLSFNVSRRKIPPTDSTERK
ncbi:MAG: hypothetical protein DRO93_06235 [Candidatus Thorarchaeota archaeon]|nr:MAG: hypothetical protein DRO93_06235 [Candidatus Thorarchaeota archaeon]